MSLFTLHAAKARWWLAIATAMLGALGCQPRHYRLRADRESYAILRAKEAPAWSLPAVEVMPPLESRNAELYDPDRPPMPPDDSAAHVYMHCADGRPGYRHWHQDGNAPEIENDAWYAALPLDERGSLPLDPERTVELALLHSREYQFELEQLYLSALALTLERFEFDVQWFLTNTTYYEHLGRNLAGGVERNSLVTQTNAGFTKAFTAGGQLVVDFANQVVWEFTGDDSQVAFSNIAVRLVQPFLRGAAREVRMEGLTQAEREVLYAIRRFTRFRKQFYLNLIAGTDGYLSLLLQLQAIRNLEANLASLEQNLRAHEALATVGAVSPLNVDQVFQSYQTGRLRLIRARNDFETSLDTFKIRLGLPPELSVQLDDSLLQPFELTSDEVTRLEEDVERLLASFRERDVAPSEQVLLEGFQDLADLQERLGQEAVRIQGELQRWRAQPASTDSDEEGTRRERRAQLQLAERLEELQRELQKSRQTIEQAKGQVAPGTRDNSWASIQNLTREVSAQAADLFVIQTQVRTYLVDLRTLDLDAADSTRYALDNRLDLLNRRAQVVDAWRKIRVAADGLEAELDVFVDADLGSDPAANHPLAFDRHSNRYRVGVQFDGPLNRLAERNIYRAQLINYQRARRDYLALRDEVVRSVRLDVRTLGAEELNFEIARQSLITAARQVELARMQLLAPGQEEESSDSSRTQDALGALNSLLDAKNALIAIWVAYEQGRLQLLLDTEALQLDERGFYRDEQSLTNDSEPSERTPSPEPVAVPEPAAAAEPFVVPPPPVAVE